MEFELEPRFEKDYKNLSEQMKERFQKKLKLFATNPTHPSFHTKPMKGYENIWEAHISKGFVFTFDWNAGLPLDERVVHLRRIGKHDIYDNP